MNKSEGSKRVKKCNQRDIDYSQNEIGFVLTDVTHLLPEAPHPSLVSARLDGELRASGDYNGQVWDLLFMSGCSPNRVRENYNLYFTLMLNRREQTVCLTQCGGAYTETFFVFALAGENIYFEHDVENPKVRELVKATGQETPFPSEPLENGPSCFANGQKSHTEFDQNDSSDDEHFNDDFEMVLSTMIGGRGSEFYEPGQLIVDGSKQPIKDVVFKLALLLGDFHANRMRDPRGHDMKQLHDVLLGFVLSSRHMWEILTEGSRSNLDDILDRLPCLLDVLDQQHEEHCEEHEDGLHEIKILPLSEIGGE